MANVYIEHTIQRILAAPQIYHQITYLMVLGEERAAAGAGHAAET
jgi:hypothetical protein